jgi:hypothetical protein
MGARIGIDVVQPHGGAGRHHLMGIATGRDVLGPDQIGRVHSGRHGPVGARRHGGHVAHHRRGLRPGMVACAQRRSRLAVRRARHRQPFIAVPSVVVTIIYRLIEIKAMRHTFTRR